MRVLGHRARYSLPREGCPNSSMHGLLNLGFVPGPPRPCRVMGIEALVPRPGTSKAAPGHKIYPYLIVERWLLGRLRHRTFYSLATATRRSPTS